MRQKRVVQTFARQRVDLALARRRGCHRCFRKGWLPTTHLQGSLLLKIASVPISTVILSSSSSPVRTLGGSRPQFGTSPILHAQLCLMAFGNGTEHFSEVRRAVTRGVG